MNKSIHLKKRMSQRGIDQKMVELALNHGVIDGDKYVLNKKIACAYLEEMKRQIRVIMRVIDKGGVVVVANGDTLITAYNCEG
ncbi:MAG: DUF4258 domain-containing protein [Pseudomonadales bacterium]|jgi:AAA+ superfamily predicted ATPase|nr:DUF4258 domain-containing protein [Pseudomonadales bacterium]